MSSLTVTVSGTDPSALVCTFFPQLELNGDGDWYVGLLDFTTYNSIPNVVDGKNNEFPVQKGDEWTTIKLPTGAYEIDDIEAYLKHHLSPANKITLRPNNNTLQCELSSSLNVDFSRSQHSIGPMLGFIDTTVLEANKTYWSDAPVNIINVNTIKIRCNIVQGSYQNGENDHTLHSFYPTVEPGFKIVETPSNVIYLPINVQRIDNITLSVVDQNGETVNFRGEVITARLHLKRML